MINVATIMKQVEEWLEDDINLDGFIVERSEFVNEDPGRDDINLDGLAYTGEVLTMIHAT